jgi:hypothetical protein
MAIFREDLKLDSAFIDFKVYGGEPEVLSLSISTDDKNTLLKLNREAAISLAHKLLSAAQAMKRES